MNFPKENSPEIQKIIDAIPALEEQDLDSWVVPEMLVYLELQIKTKAMYAYRDTFDKKTGFGQSVAIASFKEQARSIIRSALFSFIFDKEYFTTDRSLEAYLLASLNNLTRRIKSELNLSGRRHALICPGCLLYNNIEPCTLLSENMVSCQVCDTEINRLENIVSNELNVRKIFAKHSKKGYLCPDCKKFVPQSSISNPEFISCPYNDCSWFGSINQMENGRHPSRYLYINAYSINDGKKGHDSQNAEDPDTVIARLSGAGDNKPENLYLSESKINIEENFENDLVLLKSVINEQIECLKRTRKAESIVLQLNMYQAYINMIEKHQEEMIFYLVYQSYSNVATPIQSRIFQEYIKITENMIPFKIGLRDSEHSIEALSDKNLKLFTGLSNFKSTVSSEGIIFNETVETFTAPRTSTYYGPYFIGYLINITDENNNSLMDKVDYYSFMQIKLRDVEPGTSVRVSHFRIEPHYEVGPLVRLQRIRRKIVDSVYLRKHGEKRTPQEHNEKNKD